MPSIEALAAAERIAGCFPVDKELVAHQIDSEFLPVAALLRRCRTEFRYIVSRATARGEAADGASRMIREIDRLLGDGA